MLNVRCSTFDAQSVARPRCCGASAPHKPCPPTLAKPKAWSDLHPLPSGRDGLGLPPTTFIFIRCSMFDVRCSTFDVRCSTFDAPSPNPPAPPMMVENKTAVLSVQIQTRRLLLNRISYFVFAFAFSLILSSVCTAAAEA